MPDIDPGTKGVIEEARQFLGNIGRTPAVMGSGLRLAELWDTDPAAPSDPLSWYRREDVSLEYVRDLARWHGTAPGPTKQNTSAARFAVGPRALDFGSGIGSTAIALASAGLEVDCCEIGPACKAFAKWRFLNRKIDTVRFVDKPEPPYNTIVAIDVVEHLSDPETWLREAHGWLASGGRVVLTWTFHQDGCPMHMGLRDPRAQAFLKTLDELFPTQIEEAVSHLCWPSVRIKG